MSKILKGRVYMIDGDIYFITRKNDNKVYLTNKLGDQIEVKHPSSILNLENSPKFVELPVVNFSSRMRELMGV